jgi:hypothetical protein
MHTMVIGGPIKAEISHNESVIIELIDKFLSSSAVDNVDGGYGQRSKPRLLVLSDRRSGLSDDDAATYLEDVCPC